MKHIKSLRALGTAAVLAIGATALVACSTGGDGGGSTGGDDALTLGFVLCARSANWRWWA